MGLDGKVVGIGPIERPVFIVAFHIVWLLMIPIVSYDESKMGVAYYITMLCSLLGKTSYYFFYCGVFHQNWCTLFTSLSLFFIMTHGDAAFSRVWLYVQLLPPFFYPTFLFLAPILLYSFVRLFLLIWLFIFQHFHPNICCFPWKASGASFTLLFIPFSFDQSFLNISSTSMMNSLG